MKILLATPVSNDNDKSKREYIRGLKLPRDVEVEFYSLQKGPRMVETLADEISAAHHLIKEIIPYMEKNDDIDAIVINCFADPGLHPLREILDIPILGAGESAWLLACSLGHRIGHISILNNSLPHAHMKLGQMGLTQRLAASMPIETGVLSLATDTDKTIDAIKTCAMDLIDNHAADVIVLGCTGMNHLIKPLREKIPAPVVEATEAGLWFAIAQASSNLKYGRRWLYMPHREEYL